MKKILEIKKIKEKSLRENIRPKFNIEKCKYGENPVYISKLIDPYTSHLAKFFYYLGLTGDIVTIIGFLIGLTGIIIMFYYQTYLSLIIAAILITIKNLGDTIDGKITRGSEIKSTYGGFTDIVFDWLFFMPLLYLSLGHITGHFFIGFLCIIGYMSREFARRKFQIKYGIKITETKEAEKVNGIRSIVTKYDQANAQWILPIFLFINQPLIFIYAIAIIEYTLFFGELGFDYYCFFQKQKRMRWNPDEKVWVNK